MPRITFVSYSGTDHVVEAPVGRSLMRAAIDSNDALDGMVVSMRESQH